MKKLLNLPLLAVIILFSSCEKKITDLEFEKKVMTEIFPDLIESTCIDIRLFSEPPPIIGQIIYDSEGNHIGIDSIKGTDEQRQKLLDWKNLKIKLERDTSKVIIGFDPIIRDSSKDLKEDFKNHFKNSKIFLPKQKKETEYVFDFKNIKLNNKFRLKNIALFPKNNKAIWRTKYNFIFGGVVSFSRIQFDKNRQFGVLDAAFTCGRLCGQGTRIYIKKVRNKWIIDDIEGTWVS
ncbi:hypothetical protein [Flavobacterium sp. 2]|uniref:hypothetical protein n=1 Tax=Flavobacterium sp. 2 TaxID=308053 RepID=UPI000C17B85A|nr:hypothetical protein [Flavobacterium sp. 2]PIF71366.1 hypothetical protein CLU99_2137 [Flavobacterium sp. 2]